MTVLTPLAEQKLLNRDIMEFLSLLRDKYHFCQILICTTFNNVTLPFHFDPYIPWHNFRGFLQKYCQQYLMTHKSSYLSLLRKKYQFHSILPILWLLRPVCTTEIVYCKYYGIQCILYFNLSLLQSRLLVLVFV